MISSYFGHKVKMTMYFCVKKCLQIHINPCFLRTASSKTITILSKDSTTRLHDGDCFSFLPDIYWFKLKVVSNGEDEHKRQLEDGEEIPEKRQKFEDTSIEGQNEIDIQINSYLQVRESEKEADVSRSPDKEQNNSMENHASLDETSNSDLPKNSDVEENSSSQSNEDCHVVTADREEALIQNQHHAPASNLDETVNIDLPLNADVQGEPQSHSNNDGHVNTAVTAELKNLSQTIAGNDDLESTNLQEEPQSQNSQMNDAPGPSAPRPHRERCWYAAGCYRYIHFNIFYTWFIYLKYFEMSQQTLKPSILKLFARILWCFKSVAQKSILF